MRAIRIPIYYLIYRKNPSFKGLRPLRNSPKSPKFPPRHLGDFGGFWGILGDFGEFCKGLNKISVMLGLGVKVDIVESNRQSSGCQHTQA